MCVNTLSSPAVFLRLSFCSAIMIHRIFISKQSDGSRFKLLYNAKLTLQEPVQNGFNRINIMLQSDYSAIFPFYSHHYITLL